MTPASPDTRFHFEAPHAALRPFVLGYWSLDAPPRGDRFLPGLPLVWIFSLGDPGVVELSGARQAQPLAFIKGVQGAASVLQPSGRIRNYGVAFREGGARAFHRLPLGALAEQLVDLEALGDAPLAALSRRVRGLAFPDAVAAFDRFLLGRLGEADSPHLGRLLLRDLPATQATLGALARGSGYSARQLRRLYHAHVGSSPKRAQRILRLNRALALVGAGSASLAEVAFTSGYADHAHMSREFTGMVGVTPSAYRAREAGVAALFSGSG